MFMCPHCKGTGDRNLNLMERVWDKCETCDGAGEIERTVDPYSLKCAVDSCKVKLNRRFMCGAHYRMIPAYLKRRIQERLTAYHHSSGDEPMFAYRQVVDACGHALLCVEAKLKDRGRKV